MIEGLKISISSKGNKKISLFIFMRNMFSKLTGSRSDSHKSFRSSGEPISNSDLQLSTEKQSILKSSIHFQNSKNKSQK